MKLFALVGVWLIFSAGMIWILGIQPCRNSARWYKEDKIQRYVEISSPRLARLWIPEYTGFSRYIGTNIPMLYDRYYVNEYPDRLSLIGLADYCVTTVLCLWYFGCITVFFWFGRAVNPTAPIILLMARFVIFGILHGWNRSRVRLDQAEVISRAEMKQRKRKESRR